MQPGSRVGPFQLLEVIGRGGMGEVWRAHDTRLQRDVALKTLPAPFAADPALAARLAREARLMATLNHPNIAAILGLEEQEGLCWLVLELVEGPALEDRFTSKGFAWREAAGIGLQVADALEAAHSRGIVHCDLKPSNLRMTKDGRIKVLDFGIARSLQAPSPSGQTTLTVAGTFVGTPAYMSPEQMRGEPVGPTSDIWAFGVLLYQMLAGRLPFAGPTTPETCAQVLQAEPEFASLRAHVPEPLLRLLARCLEKDPRRRIQHAGDLRVLMEEALVATPPVRAFARRHRIWKSAAILGAAALLVGALAWHLRGENAASGQAAVPAARPDPSIAVLPFVNMSADPEQEYFSDGLSEELIGQLARIQGLRVTARTSAFSFKGKAQDVRNVGKALGVANVLEGSVRKSGDRLRIRARLVNVATGYQMWSETFDRATDDVFAIQDEIAVSVAGKLGQALGVAPNTAETGGTKSLEAYDRLLRGIAEFNKGSREGREAAVEEYRAALDIDPAYGRASAELAITLNALGPRGGDPVAFSREVEDATALAMKNAPDAPLTNVARMWMSSDRRQWIEADTACRAAFAAEPDLRANWICAGFLTLTGRARQARPYREAGRRADPLGLITSAVLVRQYAILDAGPELRREFTRLDGLTGERWQADEAMLAYLAHQRAPAAEMRAQLTRACPDTATPGCEAWAAAILAPESAPSRLRSHLRNIENSRPDQAGSIALTAAHLGDRALALDALEVIVARATSPSFQNLWFPLLGTVRAEPRFKRLMQDVGLVELWRQSGNWADFCRPVGQDDFECF